MQKDQRLRQKYVGETKELLILEVSKRMHSVLYAVPSSAKPMKKLHSHKVARSTIRDSKDLTAVVHMHISFLPC